MGEQTVNEFDALIEDLEYGRRARERDGEAKLAKAQSAPLKPAPPPTRMKTPAAAAHDRQRMARDHQEMDRLLKELDESTAEFQRIADKIKNPEKYAARDREKDRQRSVTVMERADAALAAGRMKPAEHDHLHAMVDAIHDVANLGDTRASLQKQLGNDGLQDWQRRSIEAQIAEADRRIERCKKRLTDLRARRPV